MIGNTVLETTSQTKMDAEKNFVIAIYGDTELFKAFCMFSLEYNF